MLIGQKVQAALAEKRAAFQLSAAEMTSERDSYGDLLRRLAGMSSADINHQLGGVPWPGARPTAELHQHGLFVPFPERWETAQEARAWALERLRGVPTLAVDGSQIAPSKEFGVPVSLVQVAWFENYHDADRPYCKDVRNEVLSPGDNPAEPEQYAFIESRLSQRRFAMEMQVAAERLQTLDPQAGPVVLVDGTFVLSFAGRLAPSARQSYLSALFGLLDASERSGVPVVGYVDLSYASDLAGLLETAFDRTGGRVFDAQILAPHMNAFDRTAAFRCARGDILPLYRTAQRDYGSDLYFVYLKTGQDRLPARLDFPGWVLEAGLLDHVVDIARAEAVVGSGYPYALETADAAAVLTTEDRLRFYRLFHDFAQESGLATEIPGKSVSKGHRR